MSSDFAVAKLDLGVVDRALIALHDPDLRGAFNLARKPARGDMKDHAKRAEGPTGSWAPRSPFTVARAASAKRRKARRLLGRLPGALELKASRRSLIVASRVKWSKAHQDGATVGHGARLPARVFVWASKHLIEGVSGLVARGLEQAFAKAC